MLQTRSTYGRLTHMFLVISAVVIVIDLYWYKYYEVWNVVKTLPLHQNHNHKEEILQTSSRIKKPHIIFILADDYGFHDIGYHGSDIRTPNLDRLAYQGVRLENYYVQPICTPTRVQLLSGRYQIHTGLQHGIIWAPMPSGLPLDSPTIADKLQESGYSTHMVGKWHVGFYKNEYTPNNRGFDTFFGFLTGHLDYYNHLHKHKGMWGYDMRNNMAPVRNETGHYSTHLFTEKVINIIKGHKPGSQPMFIYLSYQAVHTPLQVPDHYLNFNPHIQDEARRLYAGMTAAMDEGIGNVTKALKESGLWNNTLLIFSTDNGGSVKHGAKNWPLKGGKGNLYEGGIRGVGFVSGPLIREEVRGTKSNQLMHVTDWYPTLVHLANGNLSGTKQLDGYNQWNTIQGYQSSQRKEILHNIDPFSSQRGQSIYKKTFDVEVPAAIRVGDWKLITGEGRKFMRRNLGNRGKDTADGVKDILLYNINTDPGEKEDVSDSNPKKVLELLKRLKEYEKTAVPCFYPADDWRANPKLHGGFWGPWL